MCAKVAKMESTFNEINKIIIFIRSNALHRRQFRAMLSESTFDSAEVLYHNDVRWLSLGEAASRVLNLRKEICAFYSSNSKHCVLADSTFLISLAFLVDILDHVNTLNESLQGKGKSVCHLYRQVRQFSEKCRLLSQHLSQHNFFHYPHIARLLSEMEIAPTEIPIDEFMSVIESLSEEFDIRFQDFKKIEDTLRLVASPNLVEVEQVENEYQMELLELKHDEQLIAKFEKGTDLIELWRTVASYPKLRELARNTLVLFGSTYVCESAFSHMKYLKSKYRSRMANKNLEASLRLMVSQIHPNFSLLSSNCQEQGSH